MAQDQTDKRTKIKTILTGDKKFQTQDGDPLLLTMVQCSEAFSSPYYLDVVMFADRDIERKNGFRPESMINTRATVSVRREDRIPPNRAHIEPPRVFTYSVRKGVFQSFVRQDRFHRRVGRDFNVYAGRIVPAFQILDQEVRYRIFEKPDMTLTDIMNSCFAGFGGLNLTGYADTAAADADATKMEHCVQYGESTFNFLSRLMNRFSIWYYFDHTRDPDRETLVLGKGPASPANSCDLVDNSADPRDIENQGPIKNWQIVTGLSKVYTPAPRRTRTSDFNTLVPTQPIESTDGPGTAVQNNYDIVNVVDTGTDTSFVQEAFPDSTIYQDKDATDDAATTLKMAESQVFTTTGVSKNPTFYAAKCFNYLHGDGEEDTQKFLITRLAFNAYDRDYLFIVSRNKFDGLAALLDDLLVQPGASFVQQFGSGKGPDFSTAMAAAGMQDAVTNKPLSTFGSYFAAGMAGYLASFLPNVTSVLQDLLPVIKGAVAGVFLVLRLVIDVVIAIPAAVALIGGKNLFASVNGWFRDIENGIATFLDNLLFVAPNDAYSSTFIAVSFEIDGRSETVVPALPSARNAQIFGPHLATVIGQDGIDTVNGDIWADKLGRVRLRFPWDRLPAGAAGATFSSGGWTDLAAKVQYKVGRDTVWARVSDSWAGDRFGTQFLPRIGDEVLVSFIDGDPDRPIVTGRLYNARGLTFANAKDTTPLDTMEDMRQLKGSDNFKRSGIKTRSTPKGDKTTFHMLRFDDTAGKEQLLLRSQGRTDATSLGPYFDTIAGNYNLSVGGKDPKTGQVSGDYIAKVWHDYDLHVGDPSGGGMHVKVENNLEVNVKKDTLLKLEQDLTAVVTGGLSLNAGTIVLEATQKMTLKVGSSSIVLTPAAIYIQGTLANINSGDGGAASAADATLQAVAAPALADPGEPPDWLANNGG